MIGSITASSEVAEDEIGDGEEGRWDSMLPEIMMDVIDRVDSNDDTWPSRKSVVACGGVCRKWREITMAIVKRATEVNGLITFPSFLKQSGLRDPPLHCIIRRNKKTSTFYLYLNLKQTFSEKGKFLFAAHRSRNGARISYFISLDHDDISERSKSYMGKLRSNFLGTKFTLYDSEAPLNGARSSSKRFMSKQISPQVPSANYVVGQISYKFNILKSRGPRRMKCVLQYPSTPSTSSKDSKQGEAPKNSPTVILKNKAPRWHEQLQCWCLNFHGRVTVASVKNFQLVATSDPTQPNGLGDEGTVLLQFGKVADDVFTMDFRKPLSVFQAFAICLTTFGTKPACE